MKSFVFWRNACVAVFACVASSALGDDTTNIPTAPATPAPRYTQTLRVKAPSVQVRSNPKPVNDNTRGAGQYAFIDENGELTSTPPADFEFPSTDAARGPDPVPRRSTVDPNALLIDTTRIRAVMRAQVDANGKATVECLHSTDPALQKACTKPHTSEAKASEADTKTEDEQ